MKYYTLQPTIDRAIVGSKGESQISGIEHGSIPEINKYLANPSQDTMKLVSKHTFQVHYHAKITAVMTGISFRRSLLFVNQQFIQCFKGLRSSDFFVAPAKLKFHNNPLSDYSIFHPLRFREDFVNVAKTTFVVRDRSTQEHTTYTAKIHDYKSFWDAKKQIWDSGGELKPKSVVLNEDWNYDYASCKTFGLGHVVSQRFVDRLIENNITGIRYPAIQLDPFNTSGRK